MTEPPPESLRLDVWLDVACLFKTRSEAQRACKGGRVDVNGEAANPHRLIRPGDTIAISRGGGRRQTLRVRGLAERHIAKALTRGLYEDTTPPASPALLEARRIERLLRKALPPHPKRAPDKRERRELRRLKGR